MELTESDARVFFKEGMSDAELDEHEDAIKNYQRALKLNPKYTEAHFNESTICLLYKSDAADE